MLFKSEGKNSITDIISDQMKSVHFKDIYNYKDSDV